MILLSRKEAASGGELPEAAQIGLRTAVARGGTRGGGYQMSGIQVSGIRNLI
jgi:hypothetical protein